MTSKDSKSKLVFELYFDGQPCKHVFSTELEAIKHIHYITEIYGTVNAVVKTIKWFL